ncbi:MAG: hypothetical protein ACI84C_002407 [Flavobacteriales bacterium]|jgi:hypothetical protein
MKWLQNRFVVSVLGILALVIMLNNFGVFGNENFVGSNVSQSTQETMNSTGNVMERNLQSVPPPREIQGLSMELETIQSKIAQWVQSPKRNPFQFFTKQENYAGAESVLTLNAVWSQTGSRLVVINQRVLEEGDTIESYRLERIEGERAWVNGPLGLEPLELELSITEAKQKRKLVELKGSQGP